MGFICQNGAGKSTTIRSLLNIILVDNGEIRLLGLDHIKDAKDMSRIFEDATISSVLF